MMSHLLPPGRYFVGDPCHVFDDSWDDVLLITDFFNQQKPAMIKGAALWGGRTPVMKGTLEDQNGAEYEIIDGVIGAVPIELIEDPGGEDHGTIVDAPRGLLIEVDAGIFRFGEIVINTNDPNDTDFDGGHDLDLDDDTFF